MPLPFILGAGAAIAGIVGAGSAIHGAVEMKDANDTMKSAQKRHDGNVAKFKTENDATCKQMDTLGKVELGILNSFEDFSNTIEKIQNRPEFQEYKRNGIILPKYNKEELKNVSVGAGVLLGGLGGAAVGAAGGYAAAGATTAAVMALGTASTGTAIASLSGVAATNATLAALGGGAIAAGGGGMALGTTILGATTLGVGILVGGIIFNLVGGSLSDKADDAWAQMLKAEKEINTVCSYLNDLKTIAADYTHSLNKVKDKYLESFNFISYVVNKMHKTDWNDFTREERLATENSVLLVGLLYKMCQVNLVNQSQSGNGMNTINRDGINKVYREASHLLKEIA